MKIRNIMTSKVTSTGPDDSIAHAARLMADEDVGVLPVVDGGKVVGIVTDRDIAVRGVAEGTPVQALVGRIMSRDVITCSPEDELEDVLEIMSNEQVRRLPVCESEGKLVGIFALADAAHKDPDKSEVAEALNDICEPAGVHSQSPVFA
jgi:CBS-domain-containing membrane protein